MKSALKLKKLAITAALVFGFVGAAQANLITNGGFETGDLTGWSGGNFVAGEITSGPPIGNYALHFGCVNQYCATSQTISTNIGQQYTFSFYYGSDGYTPNGMDASFGNQTVLSVVNEGYHSIQSSPYSFLLAANSSLTTVTFNGFNNPAYQAIDNVSVTTAVPEPETYGMMLAGLGLMGFIVRRRKQKEAA